MGCGVSVDGVGCLEEDYLRKTEVLQQEYEEQWHTLGGLTQRMWADRPSSVHMGWLYDRRSVAGSISKMIVTREKAERQRDLELLASSQAIREKFPPELEAAVEFADFVQESLANARALRFREEMDVHLQPDPVPQALPTALSHVVTGARERYLQWFCAAAGRDVARGPPGVAAEQPVSPGCDVFDHAAWARFWLQKGGYGHAAQVDRDGWTPLMHAMQATVHWESAWRCCIGLIMMMPDERLRATATGGRMKGYTALHMACNGSDRSFRRPHVVRLLVSRNADLEARTEKGLTPWLLATATGVVDTAMALCQAGCDVFAVTPGGQNALDRCRASSTQMRRYHHVYEILSFAKGVGTVQPTVQYKPPMRHPRTTQPILSTGTTHEPLPTYHPPPTSPAHRPVQYSTLRA